MKKFAFLVASLFGLPLAVSSLVACGGAVASHGASDEAAGAPASSEPGEGAAAPSAGSTEIPPLAAFASTWTADAWGCRDFELYAPDATGTRFLKVEADTQALGLTHAGDNASFPVEVSFSNGVRVEIHTYPRSQRGSPYCSDYNDDSDAIVSVAKAIAGTVSIRAGARDPVNRSFRVTVTLTRVTARHDDGTLEALPDLTFTDVSVGWLPG